jgi:hypothetical protein
LSKWINKIYKWSNGSIDISREDHAGCMRAVARFDITIKVPLFIVRRKCKHERAIKSGVKSKDGKVTWCLVCDQPVYLK